MFSDWVSFLAYPNLFGIGFVIVVVVELSTRKSFSNYTNIVTNSTYCTIWRKAKAEGPSCISQGYKHNVQVSKHRNIDAVR
jgi:hypothetical protein